MKNKYNLELNIIYDTELPYLEKASSLEEVLFNYEGKLCLNIASSTIFMGNRECIPDNVLNKRLKDFDNIINLFQKCSENNFISLDT